MIFDTTYLFGIVFDLYGINLNGMHTLSMVQKMLAEYNSSEDVIVKMYVSSPDKFKIAQYEGEITGQIFSYQQPLVIDIFSSYEQCMEIVQDYYEECKKYVFLFTDRFNEKIQFHYQRCMMHASSKKDDVIFVLFYLGPKSNMHLCKSLCEKFNVKFVYLNSKKVFQETMKEIYVES